MGELFVKKLERRPDFRLISLEIQGFFFAK